MYQFTTSEQTTGIGADYETRALLYLMSFRKDSSFIETFIVDCFNDVTAGNEDLSKLWDVQSKGDKKLSPGLIGRYLVTLYLNHLSDIDFNHYILLVRDFESKYLKSTKASLVYDDFVDDTKARIKVGLKKEYLRRTKKEANEESINDFLKIVTFYCAREKKEDYIKRIIKFKSKLHFEDKVLERIFNEIRNQQASMKNIDVYGKQVNSVKEVLVYEKHFIRSEIETLVVNRFIGMELFNNKSIPLTFLETIKSYDNEDAKDIIQECNEDLSRTFFNKNNSIMFWRLLEEILIKIKNHPNSNANDLFLQLKGSKIKIPYTMNEISVIYLISLVKGGLE